MTEKYVIHPAIGVARVGNSRTGFSLAPNEIGGLPIKPDESGAITEFKDATGAIKRQGQKFCVYQYDDATGESKKLVLAGTLKDRANEMEVASIKWTVHLANKKSVWYEYSEQDGNLLLGENNSYINQKVAKRNPKETGDARKKLIINPGEKVIEGVNQNVEISGGDFPTPEDFPDQTKPFQGKVFTKLGDLKTDAQGNLIVLGGHGDSWGLTDLSGYAGGDYWFDDTSDGPITCEITPVGQVSPVTDKLKAWVVAGPPDFAPQIVNISSWDDVSFDVAVRGLNLVPAMYNKAEWGDNNGWNPDYVVSYERDILPIIQSISGYHWVANVQSMTAFSSNIFDFSDPSEENKVKREKYFGYFRQPETKTVESNPNYKPKEPDKPKTGPNANNRPYSAPSVQTTLFSSDRDKTDPTKFAYTGIPLMPLASGSNSVVNTSIKKFVALTETQHFLLEQWSKGLFASNNPNSSLQPTVSKYPFSYQDSASIGNVVGLPQSPGIEVTWTTQNKNIYEKLDIVGGSNPLSQLQIKQSSKPFFVDLMRDETEDANASCEPGDLTKRMAIPWQADFTDCTAQPVNYTDPDGVRKGPTYQSYWWPAQAPLNIINGLNVIASTDAEKAATIQKDSFDQEMAGLQVQFSRGINNYSQMVNGGWASLGFIRNIGEDEEIGDTGLKSSELFPYFVEAERNYDEFEYQQFSHKIGDVTVQLQNTNLKSLEDRRNRRIALLHEHIQERESLQKSLQDVKSFEKINVVHEPRESASLGRRIRF
ncbi:MAG: hypothetical protein F6K62_11495 [Sphaerospermopsis sp. SIO1G2]|nr:hypothetical protein [Sphaerospermopsis sp. SIO1G2]